MTKLSISVSMDRRTNLLAGRVVGETEIIEVTQEGMGEMWAAMVTRLDMSTTPPVLRGTYLTEPSETALRSYFRCESDTKNERAREWETDLDKYAAAVESAPREPATLYGSHDLSSWSVSSGCIDYQFSGIGRSSILRPYDFRFPSSPRRDDIDAKLEALDAEIKAENENLWQAALPAFREQKAKRDEEKAAKAEADDEAKKQALAERIATRLATGYWERDTGSYNERREGAPWCANVDFSSGPKSVYAWGESTGKWGKAGIMRLKCKPGEFIAWGQKDLRRPDKSEHTIGRMKPDGSIETFENQAEAWKAFQETKS